jgi:4-amino-4-deoxy-L-arabinose transferase-like glycosyltransferase
VRRVNFYLFLILALAIILRFWQLGRVPLGFYSDEAAYGYNTYSILKTGRDEFGRFLPLAFESFGDWKTPGYFYFMVPFVAIFGLTPLAVRLTSASLGVISVILTFYLVDRLFKDTKIALLASFFLAISPLALQFNRMAHEGNLASFLVILGTLFFLFGLTKPKWLLGAVITFALSLYAYHNTRLFTPIWVFILVVIYRDKLVSLSRRWLIISFLFGLLLALPLLQVMFSRSGWARVAGTNILGDPGVVMRIDEQRGEDKLIGTWPNRLLHNKLVTVSTVFLKNYLAHFSGDFLFASGDPIKIYQTPENGILYWWELPVLIIGILTFLKKLTKEKTLVLSWLLLAPIPSALTRFVPSASRTLIIQPTIEIILAYGFLTIFLWWLKLIPRLKYFLGILIILVLTLNLYYYFHFYYFHLPIHYARDWQTGIGEMVLAVKVIQDQYDKVWITKKAGSHIHFLFFLKYDPRKYQPQAKLGPLDEYGFGWIDKFDKYHFGDLPSVFDVSQKILYVCTAEQLPKDARVLKAIYYPDNTVATYIFDFHKY